MPAFSQASIHQFFFQFIFVLSPDIKQVTILIDVVLVFVLHQIVSVG